MPQQTLFWRRQVWEAMGPLEVSFSCAMDWDFILRVQDAGFEIRRVPRFLGCFRVHDEKKSTANRAIGYAEMQRLRLRSVGAMPTAPEICHGVRRQLLRHVALDRAYRLRAAVARVLRGTASRRTGAY